MLKVNNLSTHHHKLPLKALNASFEAGRIYTVLGRTGAGKTELLRSLIGLDAISGGQIELDGADLARTPIRSRQMAMVYQQFINYPHLNVLKNVTFPLLRMKLEKAEAETRARTALRLVGLSDFEERMPSELSGGQQQRVALARAIVKQSRILLMDEPLANLDYKLREQLREEFPRLLENNADGIIIYATTEPGEAMQLGDQLVIMHEGRIIAQGDPADLFQNPPNIDAARVISEPPISICDARVEGGRLFMSGGFEVVDSSLELPSDGKVFVGIRPVSLAPGGTIRARVTLAEFSGSDTIVHLALPFGEAVMLVEGIQNYEPDDCFGVSLDTKSLLVFSQQGQNITVRRS